MENHNIFIMALTPRSSPGKQKLFDRQGRGMALNICPVATKSYLYPLRPAVTKQEEYPQITFVERIPEMRVVPTFVESRQSNIDAK